MIVLDIVYLCGSQGVHVPLSAHQSTLPNLLLLFRCPTLGLPGPTKAIRTDRIVKVSRPPLRVSFIFFLFLIMAFL